MVLFLLMLILNASRLSSCSLEMMKIKKRSMIMALSTRTGDIPLLVRKGNSPSFLFSSVDSLRGVGPKTVDILGQLGIISVADALFHFPTNIIDRRKRYLLSSITAGDVITTELKVIAVKKGFSGIPHAFQCEDTEGSSIEIKYFYPKGRVGDMMWFTLSKIYKPQTKLIISGRVILSSFTNALEIVNPDVVVSADESEAVIAKAFGVEPIYGLTQGLTNAKMRLVIEASLSQLSDDITDPLNDWMLPEVRAQRQWPTLLQALQTVHAPSSHDCLALNSPARSRLAFDEFVAQFLHQLEKDQAKNLHSQDITNQLDYAVVGTGHYTKILEENLPFQLTSCQRTAMEEVWDNMAHKNKMSRLIQGDVGTGKTVVAIMAMLRAIEDGKQAAMLAPTEILAKQHYGVISKYFEVVSNIAETKGGSGMIRGLRVELITGNVKGKIREQLLSDVSNGFVDVLVGTTALIGDVVADSFRSLGVVIVDEEQRFGVGQRDKLASRTNTIFTTATPIPRSLMMLLEDGYTVSTLTSKPPLKRPIETVLLGSSATDKIIERISVHIPYKSKVFWVSPTLYPSDSAPGCSVMER
jgi:ATP-dependent DNA helicase RecG